MHCWTIPALAGLLCSATVVLAAEKADEDSRLAAFFRGLPTKPSAISR